MMKTNPSVHGINTRNKHHLRGPTAKLSCFQKSTYYASTKIFNSSACRLTSLKKKRFNLWQN